MVLKHRTKRSSKRFAVALTRQMIAFRDVLLSMQSEISSLRNRESSLDCVEDSEGCQFDEK